MLVFSFVFVLVFVFVFVFVLMVTSLQSVVRLVLAIVFVASFGGLQEYCSTVNTW